MKKMRVTVNGTSYDVEVEILEDDEQPGTSYGYAATASPASVVSSAPAPPRSAPPAPRPVSSGDGGVLDSPIAGVVVEVKVQPGASVQLNQPLVVIEAMKMNTNVSSPNAGKIAQVLVKAGDHVVQGQPLVKFE